MSTSARPAGWHWNDYWASGRSEVLSIEAPGGGRTLDTSAYWHAYFEGFDDGAALVDLATGSGHVARCAAAVAKARGLSFEVVGVDYSAPSVLSRFAGEGFRLVGDVALESLPFADAGLDGAASQFGIEYARPREALKELARVLRPGAPVRMLIHHADSVLTRQASAQVAAYDRVFGSDAAIRAGRRAFQAQISGSAQGRKDARSAFEQSIDRARDKLEPQTAFNPARYLVGYLTDLARRMDAYEPSSALARLEAFERGNAAWRQRQTAQTRAALDDVGLDGFVARAEGAGLRRTARETHHDSDGSLVAWNLALIRL